MSRIPMPRVSLLVLALGGALLFGQQIGATDLSTPDESAVVYTVPAASAHSYVADLHVDDAASATLR